ncbi:peptide ABC transporter permease [Frondihabitans sucicola]|uniref:Peptide ABC transporter permease n=1 Tax=Frondihabitans sucicola TaxID=1268041 RepID=A0ABN6Y1Y7_9MICO|nr:ABC transporter permease [Frondihabitans sucicola]BDZ51319.1 peptide ABC transporter permease [Frondihabitans sucicola]
MTTTSVERRTVLLGLLGRRIVQIPVVLLVVSILTFWLLQVVPGNPGRNALGQYATVAQVRAWNHTNGLDGSLVGRYLHWIGGFFAGDWGQSLVYSTAVKELVIGRLGNSLLLGLYAFVIMVPVAIALGSAQAYREGRRSDRAITVGLLSLSAVPEFVVGVVLLLVFAVWLRVVPVQSAADASGDFLDRLRVMTLPAVVLALGYLAVLTRMVRSGTSEAITSQFHRTAVLKGLSPAAVVRRHVIRNALVPTLSVLGIYLGTLLGGSVIVETLFGYPGLGALLVTAAERKDVLLLEGGVMITGAVSLLALLLTDICFVLMDPRIRFDARESR